MESPYIDGEPVVRLNDQDRFELLVSLAGVPDGLWDNMLEDGPRMPTTTLTALGGAVEIGLDHQDQVRGALKALVAAIPVVHDAWEKRQAIAAEAQRVAATWWAESGQ